MAQNWYSELLSMENIKSRNITWVIHCNKQYNGNRFSLAANTCSEEQENTFFQISHVQTHLHNSMLLDATLNYSQGYKNRPRFPLAHLFDSYQSSTCLPLSTWCHDLQVLFVFLSLNVHCGYETAGCWIQLSLTMPIFFSLTWIWHLPPHPETHFLRDSFGCYQPTQTYK